MLGHRAASAERASAALASGLRPPRIKDFRLVVAWARSADPVLRRDYESTALGAARAHTKLARHRLMAALTRLAPDPTRLLLLPRVGHEFSICRDNSKLMPPRRCG